MSTRESLARNCAHLASRGAARIQVCANYNWGELSEPHTSDSLRVIVHGAKNYDKNRLTYTCFENLTAWITVRPHIVRVIVHGTIKKRRRLQRILIWFVS